MSRSRFPVLRVNIDAIEQNARSICSLCGQYGIAVAGVVKFSDGSPVIAGAYHRGGCAQIAVSRTVHLEPLKAAIPGVQTLLTRIPPLSEAEEVARFCDVSLQSGEESLRALEEAAEGCGTQPGVILMLDVGDLREGVPTVEELCRLAVLTEEELPHVRLLGVGTNLACLNGVMPDWDNLSELAAAAEEVEKTIGRRLEIISGGSSVNLPMLLHGNEMPPRINHLRIGGNIANPATLREDYGADTGMREDTMCLEAEIVELQKKPSQPHGRRGCTWSGKPVDLGLETDRGWRRRAILALGGQDIGSADKLMPLESGVEILGSSSDHTILDVEDSPRQWKVGDTMTFRLKYLPMLYAFTGRHVNISYVRDGAEQ